MLAVPRVVLWICLPHGALSAAAHAPLTARREAGGALEQELPVRAAREDPGLAERPSVGVASPVAPELLTGAPSSFLGAAGGFGPDEGTTKRKKGAKKPGKAARKADKKGALKKAGKKPKAASAAGPSKGSAGAGAQQDGEPSGPKTKAGEKPGGEETTAKTRRQQRFAKAAEKEKRRLAHEVLLNLLPRERVSPITDGDDNGEDDNPCRERFVCWDFTNERWIFWGVRAYEYKFPMSFWIMVLVLTVAVVIFTLNQYGLCQFCGGRKGCCKLCCVPRDEGDFMCCS